jgi:hypothetical protein
MTITLESLHQDLALRQEWRVDIARLEAKIDAKPSLMAMCIVVVVFGMAGVIASTITALRFIK